MPCNVKIIALSFIGSHSMFDIISIGFVSKRASLFINIIFFQTCSRPVSSGFRVVITLTITFNVTTFNQQKFENDELVQSLLKKLKYKKVNSKRQFLKLSGIPWFPGPIGPSVIRPI